MLDVVEFGPSTYGDRIADFSDDLVGIPVPTSRDRAGSGVSGRPRRHRGPALEFGIGTGRIAIPLAERV
jgi:hypothetical protein